MLLALQNNHPQYLTPPLTYSTTLNSGKGIRKPCIKLDQTSEIITWIRAKFNWHTLLDPAEIQW